MNPSQIPVTVLGGYLGAGKTTILNRLLSQSGEAGASRRVAVLINDFGPINLDASLIAARTDSIIELTNGCICCSLADGFTAALDLIRENILAAPETAPEHLIIETSGVALPRSVAQYAHLPGFRLDAVVIAADLEQITELVEDRRVGETVRAQLGAADLILATKADLVDMTTQTESLRIVGRFTDAPALLVSDGHIPFDAVVGIGDRLAGLGPLLPSVSSIQDPADHEGPPISSEVVAPVEITVPVEVTGPVEVTEVTEVVERVDTHSVHKVGIRAEVQVVEPGSTKDDLHDLLSSAPVSCLRIKGYVSIDGRVHRADRVGDRVTIRPLPVSDVDALDTNLVGRLLLLHLAESGTELH